MLKSRKKFAVGMKFQSRSFRSTVNYLLRTRRMASSAVWDVRDHRMELMGNSPASYPGRGPVRRSGADGGKAKPSLIGVEGDAGEPAGLPHAKEHRTPTYEGQVLCQTGKGRNHSREF